MAAGYALRYYKDYGLHEHVVRLEIYRKYKETAFAPAPVEIGGVLAALNLNIQGEQDDVTAAILKTNLEIGLVDAPGIEYGRKTGDWEEFYTPDSTEFLVRLYIDGTLEWSGYITPDSFEEDITEYGVVTIVARDNIGHLQDFVFSENGNAEGMISVSELINKAWDLIECPMTLIVPDENDVIWPECYGYKPYDIMFNAEAFKEMTWLEAIENIADSLGMVIRYVGGNRIVMVPLRSLPLLDKTLASEVEVSDVLFEASGHRSLVPACKKIVDEGTFDIDEELESKGLAENEFAMQPGTYSCKIDGDSFSVPEHVAPVWASILKADGSGWSQPSTSMALFFNEFAYDLGTTMQEYEFEEDVKNDDLLYIACNSTVNRNIIFSRYVVAGDVAIDMEFGKPISINLDNQLETRNCFNLYRIKYRVSFQTSDSLIYHWAGGEIWQETEADLVHTYDYNAENLTFHIDVNFGTIAGNYGLLRFEILNIEYRMVSVGGFVADFTGLYAKIIKFSLGLPSYVPRHTEFNVTILYDEANNNLITRKPTFIAPRRTYFSPGVVKNGIFLPESGYPPATPWNWPDDSVMTEIQTLIGQQILLYNSKPNNLLTGTLLAEGDMVKLNSLWRFNDKLHILTGGSLDLLSGYIEDAQLREYVEWGELYPEPYKLITEDGYDVLTENSEIVIIGVKE